MPIDPRTAAPPRRGDRALWVAVLPCLALSVVLGLCSDGVYHDDDLTHFLMARWSAWYPAYLLHAWGRPGLTLPMAAVSGTRDPEMAWHLARVLSALVTAATALVAARLAARLGARRAWVVVLLCYAQPLDSILSFTTLSETFAALYLVLAAALLCGGRPVWASVLWSMALLSRHEALALLPLWWIAVGFARAAAPRRILGAAMSLWAPIAHNILHRCVFGTWPIRLLAEPGGSSEYPATGWLAYVPHALYAVSPLVAGLAIAGGVVLLRRRRPLVPALAAVFFLTHATIKALGVYASGGYGRFMVTVAPFVAILAALGLEQLEDALRGGRRGRTTWLALASVWIVGWIACEVEYRAGRLPAVDPAWAWTARLVLAAILLSTLAAPIARGGRWGRAVRAGACVLLLAAWAGQWGGMVRPLRLGPEPLLVREAAEWIERRPLADAPFFSAQPWFAYFRDLIEHPRAHKNATLLASMPVGTVFVWDSIYAVNQYHALEPEARYRADAHYETLRVFENREGRRLRLVVFRKARETPLPLHPKPSYPRPLAGGASPVRGIYYRRGGER